MLPQRPRPLAHARLMAVAICAGATSLHAQVVSYVRNIALPDGHQFILPTTGMPASPDGEYLIFTQVDVHGLATPASAFSPYLVEHQPVERITAGTLVAFHSGSSPADVFYLTGAARAFYRHDLLTSAVVDTTLTALIGPSLKSSLFVAPDNRVGLLANNQIYTVNPTDGAATVLLTTGGGLLSNPGDAAFGPDGMLYVLDDGGGTHRVQKFDLGDGLAEEDRLLESFNLAANVADLDAGMVISPTGHLYIADGLGGGSAYDLEGNLLDTFTFEGAASPDINGSDNGSGPVTGMSFLNMDDQGYIYVYTPETGLHQYYDPGAITAVPEPSTWTAALGIAALATVSWKRRRARLAAESGKPDRR